MAKLDFFKFDPSEWMLGAISREDLDVQGAYVQIVSIYWFRRGEIVGSDVTHLLGRDTKRAEEIWSTLLEKGYLKSDENGLTISFLDEQFLAIEKMSKQNSVNGKRGLSARRATAKRPLGERQAEEERERDKEEEKEEEGEKERNSLPPVDLILTRMSEVLGVPRSKLAQESGDIKKMLSHDYKVKEITRAIEGIPIYNLNRAGPKKVMSPKELSWNIDKILAEMDSNVNLLKATSGDLDKYKNIKLNPEDTREAREKLKEKLLGKFEK